MRTFLVSMTETKFYIVETDNDDITPDQMAEDFVTHDGNHVMQMTLAGTGIPEMEVVEMGPPSQHFKGPDDLDDNIWDIN